MYTQSRTKAVPYGFICGYPVAGVSSELYGYYEGQGGKAGAQGAAVVAAMRKWGENEAGTAVGTELGFPVCKRGFKPFAEDGERLFGCAKHNAARVEAMASKPPRGAACDPEGRYLRPGWEPFDQWVFGEKPQVSGTSEEEDAKASEKAEIGEDYDADDGAAASPPPKTPKPPASSQGGQGPREVAQPSGCRRHRVRGRAPRKRARDAENSKRALLGAARVSAEFAFSRVAPGRRFTFEDDVR